MGDCLVRRSRQEECPAKSAVRCVVVRIVSDGDLQVPNGFMRSPGLKQGNTKVGLSLGIIWLDCDCSFQMADGVG